MLITKDMGIMEIVQKYPATVEVRDGLHRLCGRPL